MPSWEPALQLLLHDWLRPGMRFIDGGANLGALSATASRLVGPEGMVVAVEPNPALVPGLRRTLEALPAPVWVVEAALWSAPLVAQPLALDTTQAHAGGSSLVRRPHGAPTVPVSTVTLDALCATDSRPTLLKLDIEGAEGHALAGASRLLGDWPIVILEYRPPDADTPDPLAILLGRGYTALSATTYRPITPETLGPLYAGAHLDLLLLPPGTTVPYRRETRGLGFTAGRQEGQGARWTVPVEAGRTALQLEADIPAAVWSANTLAVRTPQHGTLVSYTAPLPLLFAEMCVPVVEVPAPTTLTVTLTPTWADLTRVTGTTITRER